MSPTMRQASGRSTSSSTSWSSSMMATRVSRGVALIKISLFMCSQRAHFPRRLGGMGTSEIQKVFFGGPAKRCDRPRRIRLDTVQQRTERRAIGLLNQASHRKQDEREQHGQGSVDR